MIYDRELLKFDVYFNVATQIARLSKDENTNIGAVIVASDGTPVSWGYNGAISGVDDKLIPHSREEKELSYRIYKKRGLLVSTHKFKSNKYPFMSHAESNAIHFADNNKLNGSTIYVTGFPCKDCAREITRAKIKRVVIKNIKTDANSMLNDNNDIAMYEFACAGTELNIDGMDYILSV